MLASLLIFPACKDAKEIEAKIWFISSKRIELYRNIENDEVEFLPITNPQSENFVCSTKEDFKWLINRCFEGGEKHE